MNYKKLIRTLSFTLLVLLVVGVGYSYSYFVSNITGNPKKITGDIADINLTLEIENDGFINGEEMHPILLDEIDTKSELLPFKVIAGNNPYPVIYTLNISNISISSNLKVSAFKWSLTCIHDSSKNASGDFAGVGSTITMLSNKTIHPNFFTDEYIFRMWIEDDGSDQNALLNGTFSGKITMNATMEYVEGYVPPTPWDSPIDGTLLKAIKDNNTVTEPATPPGRQRSTSEEAVLASTADDYGTSYYFRGNVQNNYIVFANMCWRIVRVVGDGSIKLVLYNYSSSSCETTGTSDAFARYDGETYTTIFNTDNYRNADIGFMYGTPGSDNYAAEHANTNKSEILKNLELWYNTKLTSYESKLADTIWCNDKSMSSADTYLGYGANETYYKAYQRLYTVAEAAPSLICPNDSVGGSLSKFTDEDTTNGNGSLDKRIGLLTADEIAFAGAIRGSANTTYYLGKNATDNYWWTLSPYVFNGAFAHAWIGDDSGRLYVKYACDIYDMGGLRPAVSLKSTTMITSGDGESPTPYVVQT